VRGMFSSEIIKSKVDRLILRNFRNYSYFDFSPRKDFTVITGHNGVGKTNILEAISLLAAGKGLRGAKIADMNSLSNPASTWSIVADVKGRHGQSRVITNSTAELDSAKRVINIDDSNTNQSELSKLLSISWLVPQMGHIFIDASSIRRKFLDRMVSNFDHSHIKNITSYEYHIKERSNLLKNGKYDEDWMSIIEKNIAETGVIIATARVQFVEMLGEASCSMKYNLPRFSLKMSGFVEEAVHNMPSIQIEENFCKILKNNREIDLLSKRTNAGIHRSDMLVWKGNGEISAEMCSTGEQKFLLMSIFLTEIMAQIKYRNRLPIVLLDDAVAHLDIKSQYIFFEIVSDINAQVFVTSTFMENFSFLRNKAEFLKLEESKLMVCDNE